MPADERKTKKELIVELSKLRRRASKLEKNAEKQKANDEVLADLQRTFHTLCDTTALLADETDQDRVIKVIADRAVILFGGGDCTVYMADNDRGKLIPFYTNYPDNIEAIMAFEVPFGAGVSGRAAQTGQPQYINIGDEDDFAIHIPRTDEEEDDNQSVLAVPMFDGGGVLGVLVIDRIGGTFDENDVEKMTVFARQAEIAIKRTHNLLLLRESGEKYRTLVENVGEGIGNVDENDVFIFANPATDKIFGVQPGGLIGRSLTEYLDSGYSEIVNEQSKKRRQGETSRYDLEITRPDGERRRIILTASPKFDENNAYKGAFGIYRDVTEHRKAEEALKGSEERYRSLHANIPVGIFRTTPAGEFLSTNIALANMLGYDTVDELIGLPVADSYAFPEGRQKFIRQIEQNEVVADFETQLKRKDGTVIWVSLSSRAVADDNGEIVYYDGIVEDITERKLTEEALAQERNMFIGGPVIVFKWRNEGGWPVEYVSPNVEDVFGYTAEELTSGKVPYADIIPKADLERVGNEVSTCSESGVDSFDHEPYRIIRKDGELIWMYDFTTIIRDNSGEITHYLGYLVDITELKKSEEALSRRGRILAALSQSADTALKSADMGKSLQSILNTLGEATGVSRVYIFGNEILENGTLAMNQRYEWVASGVKPEIDNPELQGLLYRDNGFGRWADELGIDKPVYGLVSDFPEDEQAILSPQDILSIAVVPVMMDDDWWGFIGFDDCVKTRVWSTTDIETLRSAASIIGSLLERTAGEEALRESRNWFSTTLRSIGDAVITTDTEGRVTYLNGVAENLSGWTNEEAQGKILSDVFNIINEMTGEPSEDPVATVLREGVVVGLANDTILLSRDGTTWPIEDSGAPIVDDSGNLLGVVLVFQEVTERRRADKALRDSEERFRALFEASADGIEVLDDKGFIIACNTANAELLGYETSEIVGKHTTDFFIEESIGIFKKKFPLLKAKGNADAEMELVRKDGTTVPVWRKAVAKYDERGQFIGAVNYNRDIADRKKAEEERQRYLEYLFGLERIDVILSKGTDIEQIMNDVIAEIRSIFNSDRAWLYYPLDPVTKAWEVPFESYELDYPGASTLEGNLPLPADFPPILKLALESEGPVVYGPTGEMPLPESLKDFSVQSQIMMAIRPKIGAPWGLGIHQCSSVKGWSKEELGLFEDIGLRITDSLSNLLLFRDLVESEEKYRMLNEAASDAIFLETIEGRILDCNAAAYEMYGYSKEEMVGLSVTDIVPDEVKEKLPELIEREIEEGGFFLESFNMRKDGSVFPVEVSTKVVDFGNGKKVVAYVHDITYRKYAEEQLKDSLKKNEALLEALPDLMFVLDKTGTYIDFQVVDAEMLAILPEDFIGKNIRDIGLSEDYLDSVFKEIEETLKTGETSSVEYELQTPLGPGYFDARIAVLNQDHVIVVARDITERKRAEEALHESEEKYRSMMETMNDMVYICSSDFRIAYMNPAIVAEIGRDAVGENCYETLHGLNERCPWCIMGKNVLGELTEYEITSPRNGKTYLVSNSPIRHADGTVSKLTAFTDITERKRAEEQVKSSLAEKEILLKEIHHRVKNNMQIISSLLNLQAGQVGDEQLLGIFKESQNRIKAMALIHESLYKSKDFAQIDFAEYVDTLIQRTFGVYSTVSTKISLDINIDNVYLDINTSIPVALIINELVTNVVQHAFPEGRKGRLIIDFKEYKEGKYSLRVADDGVGLPDGFDPDDLDSLGMGLITALVKQIDGELKIDGEDGAEFIVMFDLNRREKARLEG